VSANLDLVRSLFAAWERGEFGSTEWVDPDIEWVVPRGPEAGTARGRSAVSGAVRGWLGSWQEFRLIAEDYRELDDERVLALVRRTGRGRTSGLELEQIDSGGAILFQIRGAAVVRLVFYEEANRALADLGLAPEGDSPPPSENVELVRRCFQAFEQGGFEASAAFVTDDFHMSQLPGWPDASSYRGPEEATKMMAEWISSFEDFRGVPEQFCDVGADRVVVAYHEWGRPRGGSAEIDQLFGILYTLREGKIASMEWFDTPDAALRAAERSEDEVDRS
jgi:ketosteroid isomerase-like protein